MIFKYSGCGELLYPNEGRLHKGNPFKKVIKEAKRGFKSTEGAISKASKQIEAEAGRTSDNLQSSDWWEKVGAAALSGLGDPRTWAAMGIAPGTGLDILSTADSAETAWQEMNDAERAEARAEIEAAQAAQEEARLIQEQEDAQREQERLTSERAREAEEQARERSTRLGRGRRGLLYQGNETGVQGKSNLLGG